MPRFAPLGGFKFESYPGRMRIQQSTIQEVLCHNRRMTLNELDTPQRRRVSRLEKAEVTTSSRFATYGAKAL